MWENGCFRTRVGQVDINKRGLGESRLPLTPLKNDPEPYPPSGARGSYVVSYTLSNGSPRFLFLLFACAMFSRARARARSPLLLLSNTFQRVKMTRLSGARTRARVILGS